MKKFKKIFKNKKWGVLFIVVFALVISGVISKDIKAQGGFVPVHDQQLQQALTNLIENSLIEQTLTAGDKSIADINEQILIAMQTLVQKEVGIGIPGLDTLDVDPQELGLTSWDGIAQEAQKGALQQMINSMEGAIFGGMEGFPIIGQDGLPIIGNDSPFFVTDLLGFLNNVGEATFFDFLGDDLAGANIDSFGPPGQSPSGATNLTSALQDRFERHRNFEKRVTPLYNLPGDPSDAQAFVEGDFSQGGWEMWFALSQDPGRNPWILSQTAEQEAERRIAAQRDTELELLRFGDGFFPMREEDGTITTPGIAFADQLGDIMGSNLRQIEMATDFDSIFNLFLGEMEEQFFSGGIFGFDIFGDFFGSFL